MKVEFHHIEEIDKYPDYILLVFHNGNYPYRISLNKDRCLDYTDDLDEQVYMQSIPRDILIKYTLKGWHYLRKFL